MTTEEKLDRLTNLVEAHDRQIGAHDTQIGNILEASAQLLEAARIHDGQIGALITASEHQKARIAELVEATANLERQWQAYLRTLPQQ